MILMILSGLLLVIGLAQIAVVIMSVLYMDDTSWFILPSAVVMIIGTVVQAALTGIWSVALISLFPQFLALVAFGYGGYVLYETANPLRIGRNVVVDSWKMSFLAARITGVWDKAISHIKAIYWAGVNSGAKLRGA